MKQGIKISGGLHQYLNASGVLNHGSSEQIILAKQNYWKEYRRKYIQEKRKEEKQFNVSFTQKEYSIVKKAAKGFNSCTEFIKRSTLAAANGKGIGDPSTLNTLTELFTLTYT